MTSAALKRINDRAEERFSKRSTLLLLWQEIAEHFYPQRADFTFQRTAGTEFATNLMTSYPLMCNRELQDQIGQMLRPTQKEWFEMEPDDPGRKDNEVNAWCQRANTTMRRAMYDRKAMLTRCTKEADGDFSAFGQAVFSVELSRPRPNEKRHFLFRTWHLRDCAWDEDSTGAICAIYRKWKIAARDLVDIFPKVSDKVITLITENKGDTEVNVRHYVVKAEHYEEAAGNKPWVSCYYDLDHDFEMEVTPSWNQIYAIPRWQTVSGSQYAYSPATVAALPEARLIQSMTYTILEAGEKAVNPPMVATQNVIRSDVALYAGAINWVDRDYDEKLGEALRPLTQDYHQLPLGVELIRDSRALLMQAFYLNKLTMPQRGAEMTAYEVGQRIQEYIRGALPLFEPMEHDYSGQLCELVFDLGLRNGLFGSPLDMPKKLIGADINFIFRSPLHDAIEQQKGTKFQEMKAMIAEAAALDPTVAAIPDAPKALRDTLDGIGVPATWLRSEVDAQDIINQQKAAAQAAQTLASMQQGADVAHTMAQSRQANADAEVMPA